MTISYDILCKWWRDRDFFHYLQLKALADSSGYVCLQEYVDTYEISNSTLWKRLDNLSLRGMAYYDQKLNLIKVHGIQRSTGSRRYSSKSSLKIYIDDSILFSLKEFKDNIAALLLYTAKELADKAYRNYKRSLKSNRQSKGSFSSGDLEVYAPLNIRGKGKVLTQSYYAKCLGLERRNMSTIFCRLKKKGLIDYCYVWDTSDYDRSMWTKLGTELKEVKSSSSSSSSSSSNSFSSFLNLPEEELRANFRSLFEEAKRKLLGTSIK